MCGTLSLQSSTMVHSNNYIYVHKYVSYASITRHVVAAAAHPATTKPNAAHTLRLSCRAKSHTTPTRARPHQPDAIGVFAYSRLIESLLLVLPAEYAQSNVALCARVSAPAASRTSCPSRRSSDSLSPLRTWTSATTSSHAASATGAGWCRRGRRRSGGIVTWGFSRRVELQPRGGVGADYKKHTGTKETEGPRRTLLQTKRSSALATHRAHSSWYDSPDQKPRSKINRIKVLGSCRDPLFCFPSYPSVQPHRPILLHVHLISHPSEFRI